MQQKLISFDPHCIHIATEGPLGWAARSVCKNKSFTFSTSYHTRFPEYVGIRLQIPLSLSYALLRRFHRAAATTMVATSAIMDELQVPMKTTLRAPCPCVLRAKFRW